jgi:Concanavalin A-like lectin/glucanases superfamily
MFTRRRLLGMGVVSLLLPRHAPAQDLPVDLVDYAHPLARDLLAWYPMLPHLSNGRTWYDLGRYGSHATNVNNPLWRGEASGRFGGELRLTGTNYSSVDDVTALAFNDTDPHTLALWFHTTATALQDLVAKAQNVAPYTGYWIYMTAGQIVYQLADDVGGLFAITTTGTFHDGRLHHLVATYDGSDTQAGLSLYVDGRLQPVTLDGNLASGLSSTLNTLPARFGANGSADENFVGGITNVMVYLRALSAREVQALFQHRAPDYGGLLTTGDLVLGLAGLPGSLGIKRKSTIE